MDTQPTFGPKELLTHVVGDIADAVSQRPGESQQRQLVRTQAAVHTIMEFRPDGAIEAMFAGHCLMFHEMIVDSVRTTMRAEQASAHRATRANIVAMDKAFGDNLVRLERHRRAKASPETHQTTETEIADRVHRHKAEAAPSAPETGTVLHYPSPEMAPTVQPDEAWPAAGHTSAIQSQDPRTLHSGVAYHGNRQARRHPIT